MYKIQFKKNCFGYLELELGIYLLFGAWNLALIKIGNNLNYKKDAI
jgi:hypothetical protein